MGTQYSLIRMWSGYWYQGNKMHTSSKEIGQVAKTVVCMPADHLRRVTEFSARAELRWGTTWADRWVCRHFIS